MTPSQNQEHLRSQSSFQPEFVRGDGPLRIQSLNRVASLATHREHPPNIFEFAPHKIQTRLMLLNYGWCGLGTIFIPPNDPPSLADFVQIQATLNSVNGSAGRPHDTDMIIRTSGFRGADPRWTEPAYLLKQVGADDQRMKILGEDAYTTDSQKAMECTRSAWMMCHSDNFPLQKNAIHGRLFVQGDEKSLEIGTNVPHARALENGKHTNVRLPQFVSRSFFDSDMFVPSNLAFVGSYSPSQQEMLMTEFAPAGRQLTEFVGWVTDQLNLHRYVVEFRHYLGQCAPSERFNVMDLNERF